MLRSRRLREGRGLTRGFSRAGAWGPGRGGGGCAWLGWRCSPFNRRRRASPPPPRPFSRGSSRPARRAPPPGPGPRRRRVPPRPSLGPARAAGSGRSGRRNPVWRRRWRRRRAETEEDAAPAFRARGCGRRPRIGGGEQRGRCSGAGERGGAVGAAWRGGGGRSPRPARRPPAPRCSAAPFLHPPLRGAGASALRAAAASCPAPGQAPALGMANLRPVAASASAGPRFCC